MQNQGTNSYSKLLLLTYWKYFALFCNASDLFLTLVLNKDMVSKDVSALVKSSSKAWPSYRLKAWMEHRGISFSWKLVYKHNIIQYTELVNIKYFILSKKVPWMFEFCSYYEQYLLHAFAYYEVFSSLWNVCCRMLYLRSWYRFQHMNSKKLVGISYLGDALFYITSQKKSTWFSGHSGRVCKWQTIHLY